MTRSGGFGSALASASIALLLTALPPAASFAQEHAAAADTAEEASSPKPLSDDELEVLVARIALYPDELVALVSGASLYPCAVYGCVYILALSNGRLLLHGRRGHERGGRNS